jgi:hypothetical protein
MAYFCDAKYNFLKVFGMSLLNLNHYFLLASSVSKKINVTLWTDVLENKTFLNV